MTVFVEEEERMKPSLSDYSLARRELPPNTAVTPAQLYQVQHTEFRVTPACRRIPSP